VLGLAGQPPWPAISDVAAPDPRHIVVHWKLPFPDADTLATKSSSAFPPLPRHILETVFDQISTSGRDAFDNHPYWGAQYVGAGPYRVQRWETGTFIDAVRFDQYALGAAKIPRIELRFSADQNVVIASLLAGAAHVATDSSISKAPEALTQQWGQSRAGAVFQAPSSLRYMGFQLRAEVANPRAILDARVRKAVAHAVDKAAVNEAIYAGLGVYADTPVWEGSAWGEALDSSIPTYPLDPRATESLMNQAGFTKGSDGFYRGQDGRLSLEVATTEGADNVREMLVYADRLAAAGLSVEQRALPAAQAQNGQVRSSFPSMQITGIGMGEQALNGLASSQISTADNKWTGGNVNGWSSAAFDALLDGFNTTLNRSERVLLVRHMLRVFADELPMVALFFNAQPFAYVKELRGPAPTAPESNLAWNIHEWEFE
jgi:peptide/nickel transport system substrate-binding protein